MITEIQPATWRDETHLHVSQNGTQPINLNWPERIVSISVGLKFLSRGLRKMGSRPLLNIPRTIVGGYLIYRGVTGNCPIYTRLSVDTNKHESVNIKTTLTVNKPRHEVFNFWRRLENLPRFMTHLKNVKEIDSKRSHWEAMIPGNVATISWEAEIVKEIEGTLISWQSLPGSTIENAGKVEFRDALGHQGTEIRVVITYRPLAGAIGTTVAKLLNPVFKNLVRQDVLNFKQVIEGAPQGRIVN